MNRRIDVVIVNGAPRSGKDSFITRCKSYINAYECAESRSISTINPVKDLLVKLGWNRDKTDESRKLLSDLKKFWISNNDGPTKYVVDKLFEYINCSCTLEDDYVIFVQIREPDEIEKLRSILKSFGYLYSISVTTLIVHRKEADEKTFSNESDSNTARYKYDVEVNNDGSLKDLDAAAHEFIDKNIWRRK